LNEWLVAALVLIVAMVPLGAVCVAASVVEGLVALQLGGTIAALALMMLAEGIHRQPFADLALILAMLSFIGPLAFAFVLERMR
jgi:multisubunit Na+/H+ antiporter MnhF subunit